ncbi:hypothetical protein V5O48_019176, partial [Marasmius crinis-equi]
FRQVTLEDISRTKDLGDHKYPRRRDDDEEQLRASMKICEAKIIGVEGGIFTVVSYAGQEAHKAFEKDCQIFAMATSDDTQPCSCGFCRTARFSIYGVNRNIPIIVFYGEIRCLRRLVESTSEEEEQESNHTACSELEDKDLESDQDTTSMETHDPAALLLSARRDKAVNAELPVTPHNTPGSISLPTFRPPPHEHTSPGARDSTSEDRSTTTSTSTTTTTTTHSHNTTVTKNSHSHNVHHVTEYHTHTNTITHIHYHYPPDHSSNQ